MVFNETILGALIIGVLVGGAILYTNSKSYTKQLATGDGIDVGRRVKEALPTEERRQIIIRKEINTDSDTAQGQPARPSAKDSNEVRIELRLDGSTLEPAEIAEKIEKALQSGLQQLPFNVEVNINTSSS
jgi:hypothetical protein|tara:strand:+ start:114 stop:503 length:390 start_codon:yes stop_codon:yes gene_type:complete